MHQLLSSCTTTHAEAMNDSVAYSSEAGSTLVASLDLMQGIVAWLIKSGVGYAEFSSALKPLFYNAAIAELDEIAQKKTDSSLSLISGLHRRDVSQYKNNNTHQRVALNTVQTAVGLPLRVLQLWQSKKYPSSIQISGEQGFDALVKEISTEKHPRSVLFEMKRLNMLSEENGEVSLNRISSASAEQSLQQKQHLVDGLKAHFQAGIKNLFDADTVYLHDQISFDQLSLNSVHKLNVLSADLWEAMREKLSLTALECKQRDAEHAKAIHSFQVGAFAHFE